MNFRGESNHFLCILSLPGGSVLCVLRVQVSSGRAQVLPGADGAELSLDLGCDSLYDLNCAIETHRCLAQCVVWFDFFFNSIKLILHVPIDCHCRHLGLAEPVPWAVFYGSWQTGSTGQFGCCSLEQCPQLR